MRNVGFEPTIVKTNEFTAHHQTRLGLFLFSKGKINPDILDIWFISLYIFW